MTYSTSHSPSRVALRLLRALSVAVAFGVVGLGASAWAGAGLPAEFEGVDVKNKLGEKVDLDLTLVDHAGQPVKLAKYFDGERPVILTLNYYRCDSLCSTQLNELLKAVRQLEWVPGEAEFQMVTVSFDPRDDTETAAGKRTTYAKELVRLRAQDAGEELTASQLDERAEAIGWEFMTGERDAITALSERLGYEFKYDEKSGQYAHSPVVYVMSPDGVISRYLFGITYKTQDLKFALIDASNGEIGDFGEKVLLSCFSFDPDGGGYAASAFGIMRLGAIFFAFVLSLYLLFHFRRERARRARAAANTPSAA